MKQKSITSNPTVGEGATIYYYSDRKPATVVQVGRNGKRIIMQEDIATRIDKNGMSEVQSYEYKSDPNGEILIATLRKDKTYRLVGSKTLVSFGYRQKYYDYSF